MYDPQPIICFFVRNFFDQGSFENIIKPFDITVVTRSRERKGGLGGTKRKRKTLERGREREGGSERRDRREREFCFSKPFRDIGARW